MTGKLPFVGEDSASTAAMRLIREPLPPSTLNLMISPELESVVLKAMARLPDERYKTAAEFKQAIDALLSPGRGLAYLQEARAELEKVRTASTTQKKRLLANCVKLSQMALTEHPEHPEAIQLLQAADARLSGINRRALLGVCAAVMGVMVVIALLAMQLSRGNGSLELVTNEAADVYLDGKMIGTAPLVFTDVPVGKHRIYIEQPGFYKSQEREIIVKKGIVESISEPIPDGGTIEVSSLTPGTPVLLDGKDIGKTPLTQKVVVGTHLLKVAGKEMELVVIENETSKFSF